jgi:hypothetical protein
MKLKVHVLFTLALFSTISCRTVDSRNDVKVTNGDLAADGQFSSVVGMLVEEEVGEPPRRLSCTMTKISEDMFVTASHCFYWKGVRAQPLTEGKPMAVLHGVWQPHQKKNAWGAYNSIVTDTKITGIFFHPTWKDGDRTVCDPDSDDIQLCKDSDIALLQVADPTPHIPIAIIDITTPNVGDPVYLVGYGCQLPGEGTDAQRFLTAKIETVADLYSGISSAATSEPTQGGICPGDSGGSLLRQEDAGLATIIGINSRFSFDMVDGVRGMTRSYFTRLDVPAVKEWLCEMKAVACP